MIYLQAGEQLRPPRHWRSISGGWEPSSPSTWQNSTWA